MKPTDQEIQQFAAKISDAQRNSTGANLNPRDIETVSYLLVTITSQAEIIAKLISELNIANVFGAVSNDTVAASGIGKFRDGFTGAQLNDFTFADAEGRIRGVLREIQQQDQIAQTLESVAKFAVKFAPLLLA